MATTIDELLVGLGFDYDKEGLTAFKKDLDNTINIVKKITQAAVAAATAITAMTIASTTATDEQGKLAKEIGDTVENIDALQFSLRRAGGTADGMTASLRQLAIRSSEAARGTGSGVEAFGLLGISVTDANGQLKTTSALMLEVSRQFQGLSKSRQIELADKLGIRDSVLLLQEGPEAIKALINEAKALGVTTGQDAAIAEEFQDSLTDVWQIMKQMSRTISRVLAPLLNGLVDTFTEWWKTNRRLLEQQLPHFIDQITRAFKLLTLAAAFFLSLKLVTLMFTLATAMKKVSIAALLMNISMALLPALILAAVVALGALAEDALIFFEGGDSFLGSMIEKFPQWGNEIKAVAKAFKTLTDGVALTVSFFQTLVDLFSEVDRLAKLTTLDKILGSLQELTFGITAEDRSTIFGGAPPALGTQTNVEKIEIFVEGVQDPGAAAREVFNQFTQASEDLASPVDQ